MSYAKYKLVCLADTDTYKQGIITTSDIQHEYSGILGDLISSGVAEWQENTIDLSILKTDKIMEIKTARDLAEAESPFIYQGKPFDYNDISQKRLNKAISVAEIVPTFEVDWTLADNTIWHMTSSDFLGFPIAEAQRSGALHEKARLLKIQIDNATTIEELNNITW